MNEHTYYRSTHSDVLAAWDDTQRRLQEMRERVGALEDEFSVKPLVRFGGGRYRFAGFDEKPPVDAPDGWRQIRGDGSWWPVRRSKAGKALYERLHSLKAERLAKFPGMPDMVFALGKWFSPGAFHHDGALWVSWSCEAKLVEASDWGRHTFDASMWEQVKASAYHLAVEANEVAS